MTMNDKQRLRQEARALRQKLARAIPEHAWYRATHRAEYFDDLGFASDAVVAGYWPFREEADPRPLMEAFAAKGHPLVMPRVAGRTAPLEFHRWIEGNPLRSNAFGITEPLTTAEIMTPSILLVPMLAFDATGHRLGYGGGYYDRTLALLRSTRTVLAIGIAYAGQEVPELPHGDEPLDILITENGVRRFTR